MVAARFVGAVLARQIENLSRPLAKLQTEYKDALVAISNRADRADQLAKTALDSLGNFERAVGDKRSLEAAVKSLTEQTAYLQERLTEMQRAAIGLVNPKLEATLTGQTNRAKEEPEDPYHPPPPRWAAASGLVEAKPFWGDKTPLVEEIQRELEARRSVSFRGADLSTMAARESLVVPPKYGTDPQETV